MDISETLAPTSDQLDAVDLLGGPRVFTITGVSRGSAEQPVNIALAEFPRVWRPGKSMRRVLAACWGVDASAWTGRKVRLYCDESVTFGKDKVGGTRISHLSHLDKARTIPLLVTRGKSASYRVDPLTVADEVEVLRAEWHGASPERRAAIEAEVKALTDPSGADAVAADAPATSRAVEPSASEADLPDTEGDPA